MLIISILNKMVIKLVHFRFINIHLPGFSNGPGQPLGAACSRQGAERDLWLSELGLLARVNDVAPENCQADIHSFVFKPAICLGNMLSFVGHELSML